MFMFLVIIEVRHSLLQKPDASGCIEVKLTYKILDNRPLLSLAINYTCCEAGYHYFGLVKNCLFLL